MDDAYSHTSASGLADKASLRARLKMYDVMSRIIDLPALDAILDVGVTAEKARLASNYFEKIYPHKEKITALSNQDASWLETIYPGLKFVHGDGRQMPFEADRFDLVFSSAVLEHVGSAEQQAQFISECVRVSRKHVVLTTPNRWHPIEFHTSLPLLHWLPKSVHRGILKTFGMRDIALESNLNLLGESELSALVPSLPNLTHQVRSIRFLGFRSNLMLFIEKAAPS